MSIKIGVVGAGIFGITVSIKLAKYFQVDLLEKSNDILTAASGINQFRLHRGYHYPRSAETIVASLEAEKTFEEEYKEAIIEDYSHYYCIAKNGSLTTADQFLDVCKKFNLDVKDASYDLIDKRKISACFQVKEKLIDPVKIKELCKRRLNDCKVNVKLGVTATNEIASKYDYLVNCTYSNSNWIFSDHHTFRRNYQFELCEKIAVKLPKTFNNKSLVVLDGPFFCVDPYGRSDLFLLGNVVHAIHSTNIGVFPQFDKKYEPLLNKGIINNPPITNFKKFIDSASEYIPEMRKAEHAGSMYTIRAVLPGLDNTDDRPTLFTLIDGKVFHVFSGKYSSCVGSANDVMNLLKEHC